MLAGRPSYDPTERHPPYLLRREVQGNVTVERVGSTAFPRFRMMGRVSNYLSYLALAVPRALSIRSDVVVAMTDPPFEGLAGAFVSKLTGRPFVYNLRDMYPDMALGGDIVRAGRGDANLGIAASPRPAPCQQSHRARRRHARTHPLQGR